MQTEAEVVSTENKPEESENKNVINLDPSPGMIPWLFEHDVSIVFSSYQLGKFFLIGRHPPSGISVFQRNFTRCMGIAVDSVRDTIYLSSLHQIWKFKNTLPPGDDYKGYDRLYSPQASYFTGEIDVHDMALTDDGKLIFVNTLFSCLSVLNEDYSFEPIWKPSFITKLAPEDRCHLNGLAMENGQPRYVSYFSQTNSPGGWRDYKQNGGGIIDITTGEVVCTGLSMPHSPRIYRNKLWVLNSGTGYLGYVDLADGKFHEVVFCPGYLRGLQFVGDYAIVGLSHLREKSVIAAEQLEQNFKKHDAVPHCGVYWIDLRTGSIVHTLELSGSLAEIYDLGILPKIVKPMAMGLEGDGLRRVVSIPKKPGFAENKAFLVLENIAQ